MKYITTKKQFMYIFGDRQAYLRRLRERKELKTRTSFLEEEEKAIRIEEETFKKETQKKIEWDGQVSADLQYNGHDFKYFNYLLRGE